MNKKARTKKNKILISKETIMDRFSLEDLELIHLALISTENMAFGKNNDNNPYKRLSDRIEEYIAEREHVREDE